MIEITEKEENEKTKEREDEEKRGHAQEMREANLEGVEGMLDDASEKDEEWAKLAQVPGLTDEWANVREKFKALTEDFKVREAGGGCGRGGGGKSERWWWW